MHKNIQNHTGRVQCCVAYRIVRLAEQCCVVKLDATSPEGRSGYQCYRNTHSTEVGTQVYSWQRTVHVAPHLYLCYNSKFFPQPTDFENTSTNIGRHIQTSSYIHAHKASNPRSHCSYRRTQYKHLTARPHRIAAEELITVCAERGRVA
jgi:hypothetical protein